MLDGALGCCMMSFAVGASFSAVSADGSTIGAVGWPGVIVPMAAIKMPAPSTFALSARDPAFGSRSEKCF
jgi:hypothetical protein